jgi:hypothetical protein
MADKNIKERFMMKDQALKLMEGAWDTHVHAAPGISPSKNTVVEIAREAASYRMGGIVYKDLNFSTAPQASLVSDMVGLKVVGGVTLSACLGGVNPFAVEASFKMGGKVVWMFALDSAFQVKQMTAPGYAFPMEHNRNLLVPIELGGYSIFKEGTETLTEEAREIVSLCKKYGGVLETSHLSPEEGLALFREGKNQGLKKMVVTHANSPFTPYTGEQLRTFMELGAVINLCFVNYLKEFANNEPIGNLTKLIRRIGVHNVVLGTDAGSSKWPTAVECVRIMIEGLLEEGFTADEITQMVAVTPTGIYG